MMTTRDCPKTGGCGGSVKQLLAYHRCILCAEREHRRTRPCHMCCTRAGGALPREVARSHLRRRSFRASCRLQWCSGRDAERRRSPTHGRIQPRIDLLGAPPSRSATASLRWSREGSFLRSAASGRRCSRAKGGGCKRDTGSAPAAQAANAAEVGQEEQQQQQQQPTHALDLRLPNHPPGVQSWRRAVCGRRSSGRAAPCRNPRPSTALHRRCYLHCSPVAV